MTMNGSNDFSNERAILESQVQELHSQVMNEKEKNKELEFKLSVIEDELYDEIKRLTNENILLKNLLKLYLK